MECWTGALVRLPYSESGGNIKKPSSVHDLELESELDGTITDYGTLFHVKIAAGVICWGHMPVAPPLHNGPGVVLSELSTLHMNFRVRFVRERAKRVRVCAIG